MAKASGANRLGHPHLRVIAGGMRSPVERIEPRFAGKRGTVVLIRAAIVALVIPLSILTVLVAVAAHDQVEHTSRFTLLLLGLCTGLLGLGIALAARAYQQLRGGEQRPGTTREKIDPPPAGQTRG
ncbi:MAG: hypothetical protein ACHQ9S_21105 [Candidatus Binatia bacterium]